MRVLITQPTQDADTTAAGLSARGHDVVRAPLMTAERVASPKNNLAGAQGFVVTSAEGARALADHVGVRTFPVFTDSPMTAGVLTALGFKQVFTAADDTADLARLIEADVEAGERRAGVRLFDGAAIEPGRAAGEHGLRPAAADRFTPCAGRALCPPP